VQLAVKSNFPVLVAVPAASPLIFPLTVKVYPAETVIVYDWGAVKSIVYPFNVPSTLPAVNWADKVVVSLERTTHVAWPLTENPRGFFPDSVYPALKVTTLESPKSPNSVS